MFCPGAWAGLAFGGPNSQLFWASLWLSLDLIITAHYIQHHLCMHNSGYFALTHIGHCLLLFAVASLLLLNYPNNPCMLSTDTCIQIVSQLCGSEYKI